MQIASNQSHTNRNNRAAPTSASDLSKTSPMQSGPRSNTSLSSALVAPPPPPPPLEDTAQPGMSGSQGVGGSSSQPNFSQYGTNYPTATGHNSQQSPCGMSYAQGGTPNQFNNTQQPPDPVGFGAFGNFGSMPGAAGMMGGNGVGTGFPPGGGSGGYSAGGFGRGMNIGGMGVNSVGMGGQNMTRPYGNNPMFPNQNQGQPRYW